MATGKQTLEQRVHCPWDTGLPAMMVGQRVHSCDFVLLLYTT